MRGGLPSARAPRSRAGAHVVGISARETPGMGFLLRRVGLASLSVCSSGDAFFSFLRQFGLPRAALGAQWRLRDFETSGLRDFELNGDYATSSSATETHSRECCREGLELEDATTACSLHNDHGGPAVHGAAPRRGAEGTACTVPERPLRRGWTHILKGVSFQAATVCSTTALNVRLAMVDAGGGGALCSFDP